ncbi:ABC transporter ATP-binding protein [Leifsonia sp. SIMBA_070]|uniref:ABC transporter ATP-binding protein n=1 Tax=Leifsonia sp. SIMBA_070 TaxID=3085810 RepID=UPI003978E370
MVHTSSTEPVDGGMAMLSVSRTFSDGVGVHDLSLRVAPGEVHALVGLNGAGKSTLMKLLLGMLRPDSGRVMVGGHDTANAPAGVWAAVGHLVETPLAYRELTVAGNLQANATLQGVTADQRKAVVGAAVKEFGLAAFSAKRARVLSSGNRQRLGLAAALQHRPRFVVLDEPTNALDPAGTILLRDVLRRRADDGAAILISSHHLDEVARVADRITVMNAGRLIGGLDPTGAELEQAFFAVVLADDEARSEPQGSAS